MSSAPVSDPGGATLRERLIAAAARRTAERGWASLTMAKLAADVGVSRQTVYNELGNKAGLAAAMVMAELGRFLDVVDAAFAGHPDDLVAAVRTASFEVLRMGAVNPLVRAALTARSGAEADLLPLLTTHSEPVLDAARRLVAEHVARHDVALASHRVDELIDMVVRLVLSHVVRPGGTAAETADTIAWLAGRALA